MFQEAKRVDGAALAKLRWLICCNFNMSVCSAHGGVRHCIDVFSADFVISSSPQAIACLLEFVG